MNGKKRSHTTPELGIEPKPKRRGDCRQGSYPNAQVGPLASTITTQLPTSMRHLRPVPPKPASTPPEGNPSVNVEMQTFQDQLLQDEQQPRSRELPPHNTLSQSTLLHILTAESASIPVDPTSPHISTFPGGESQAILIPVSDSHTAVVFRNETETLNLFDEISHIPLPHGDTVSFVTAYGGVIQRV